MRTGRLDGIRLTVPPPAPQGWRDRLAAHLGRLSPASRMNRFLAFMSDAALARHAAATEPDVVIEARIGGQTRGIAEVHLGASAGASAGAGAEIALSVEDGWQRRGVGAALFALALAEARRRGAADVWVCFLATNRAMGKISERAGLVRVPGGDPAVLCARLAPAPGGAGGRGLH